MCGIVGYFDQARAPGAGAELLRRMCDRIAHRGPDDEGYSTFAGAGIGVRRLSIIDLAGGHQPQISRDCRSQIVFNGEIYNYREIRKALAAKGLAFRTASDTEVILRQYEEVGEDCVQALNGMFAFAIWDDQRRSLLLARDRLGEKPLYYCWDGRALVFASEIKCLFEAGVARRLDPQSLWDYLTFRFVPQPRTIWEGVRKLLPGHTLTISAFQPEPVIRRYWECPPEETADHSDEQWRSEFESLFTDAVRLRLIADVPVGVLLSGGLDSSAVLLTAANFHSGKMKTFSVGYDGEFADDERRYARIAAAAAGADHAEIQISDRDFLEFLPRFVLYTDEPLADLASVPLYYVSHLAADQVKVVLSGEGSDEVLGGYDLGTAARRWALIRSLRRLPGHRVVAAGLKALGDTWGELGRELEIREDLWWERRPPTMTNLLSTAEKRALLRPEFAPGLTDSLDGIRRDYRSAPSASRLGQLLHVYRQSWMVEDLLMKADRMTMANSIELRVPFLDFRLVEWAARAPAQVKVRRIGPGEWETKWALRDFCRGRLPREIVSRPKRGFPVPAYERLSSSMRAWAEGLLSPRDARIKSWLREEAVRDLLVNGVAAGSSSHDRHVLWSLLILEIWARAWNPL